MKAGFHRFCRIVKGMNPPFIVLIPEKDCGSYLDDYRTISLIGCLLNIISKVLVSRVSKVLENVISENQSTFIGGDKFLKGLWF